MNAPALNSSGFEVSKGAEESPSAAATAVLGFPDPVFLHQRHSKDGEMTFPDLCKHGWALIVIDRYLIRIGPC